MGALDVPESRLAEVVAWYSLMHVAAHQRARVLRPGGYALLAF